MSAPTPVITLGLVNDNLTSCEIIRRLLSTRPDHHLLWTAYDGEEAVACCQGNPPDIVLMDVIMPNMNGIEATRQIIATTPSAVLLVTWSIPENTSKVFEAMGAGAIDVVTTPSVGNQKEIDDFFRKISQIQSLRQSCPTAVAASASTTPALATGPTKAIFLGASAGGPAALSTILSTLPGDLPAAIVIAQHMDIRFAEAFITWLDAQSPWPVRQARSGETLSSGTVFVAGGEHHLVLKPGNTFGHTDEPALAYTPSVDVLFASASEHGRGPLAGVLLTGMGSDGAKGLKSLRDAGHLTIAQDASSSALYGMPKAAAALGAAEKILPLGEISRHLIHFARR